MNSLSDPFVQATLKDVFRLVLPEIILLGTSCLMFLFGVFLNRRGVLFVLALAGILGAALVCLADISSNAISPSTQVVTTILPDGTSHYLRLLTLASGVMLVLMSWSEVLAGPEQRNYAAEYYGCLLAVLAGTSLVGIANDLITLFLALELLSIPTYVLLYLPVRTARSQEAALKYFLLSVLASAILLFGFSYLYGLTGTTNLAAILHTLTMASHFAFSPLSMLAIVLAIAGLGFRIGLVPFHFYAPDVYQGGPTNVVAMLSLLPKIAGFAALARLLGLFAGDEASRPFEMNSQIPLLLAIIAAITMTLGNIFALLQDNLKRMLAYSSIAHGGYMLLGIVAATAIGHSGKITGGPLPPNVPGVQALLFYLVAYGAMTLCVFALILHLNTPDQNLESIEDLAGLGQTRPVAAAMMSVAMFSLIGLPLTAGFVGKLLLFLSVLDVSNGTAMGVQYRGLVIVAAVNAAIAAYYYLRVVGVMYLRAPLSSPVKGTFSPAFLAAGICSLATVAWGFYPNSLLEMIHKTTQASVTETASSRDGRSP